MTTGKQDPWLHFYEDFLQEYDPKLRKDAGAYYTPLEVVHAQVAIVDEILRTKMDKPMGFAEGGVTTLDPAVGTGTYLLSIVEHAMQRVSEEEGKGAIKGRASLLASSLYGFELMVGPYAVAALRMTRMLQDFGGGIPGDGVQVFLNNTLESPYDILPELPMMYRAIGLEHQRAKRVKESVPVLVCIGNPPYDRHEKSSDTNKMGTGAWVRFGETKDGKDAILNDFIEPVKAAGKGNHLKNLYNLYVYFWRWGLWKVFEQPFAQTGGIVSFITASSFLDGDAFLGMRRKMRQLCDEIWIIDIGGDSRGTQQDDNVFAIQTPVAIAVAVRYEQPSPKVPAVVRYARLEGSRSEKLNQLKSINGLSDITFTTCNNDWQSPFMPRDMSSTYFEWPKLLDLMPWQHSGSQFKRSWPIGATKEIVARRWNAILSLNDRVVPFRESRDRKITSKVGDLFDQSEKLIPIADLDSNEQAPLARSYGFRSFDRQYALVDNRLGDYLRPALWLSSGINQVYFATTFSQIISRGPVLTASADVPDMHYFNGRGAKDIIPLFRDSEGIHPNIHPGLLTALSQKLSIPIKPLDWACYLYAVLSHPSYAARFTVELCNKDIRIPITLNLEIFNKTVLLGRELLFLHTHGSLFSKLFSRLKGTTKCIRAVSNKIPTSTFEYFEERKILRVGDGEFGPVSAEVWNFSVSGLEVVPSWLGYRMENRSGKKTSPLDGIGLECWTSGLTTDLLHLLWILEKTVSLHTEHIDLLDEILAGSLLLGRELSDVPSAYRKAPKNTGEQEELDLL
jgi:hypothetical protein